MPAPATPANLAIADTASNQVKLTWDNVAGETGFYIYKSWDGGTIYERRGVVAADTLVYYDKDVGYSTQYYYKVSAYNADGESAMSAAVNTTTLAKSAKHTWIGGVKTHYDVNAVYRDEVIRRVGGRSETVFRAEEDADAASEILRYDQLGVSVAPANATYVTMSVSGSLDNERVLTAGDAISVTDGGAGSTATIAVDPAAHVAGASESHTITDPGDSPADADALRDDLVTNTIPSIESALNALGVKINAIISALETAKLMETS